MRDYAQIRSRFWIAGTGKELRGDHEARELCCYLMSAPTSNMIGLYYLPIPTIAHELGSTIEGASKALQRVCAVGFCAYDPDEELVFVFSLARENIGASLHPKDKQAVGVQKQLDRFKKHRFYAEFLKIYGAAYGLKNNAEPPSPFQAPSIPHRSQEQDQEQDQDQEQERERARAAPPPTSARPPAQALARSTGPTVRWDLGHTSKLFSEMRKAAGYGPYQQKQTDYHRLQELTDLATAEADERGTTPEQVLRWIFAAWFASNDKFALEARFSFATLTDPGTWLASHDAAQRKSRVTEVFSTSTPEIEALGRQTREALGGLS